MSFWKKIIGDDSASYKALDDASITTLTSLLCQPPKETAGFNHPNYVTNVRSQIDAKDFNPALKAPTNGKASSSTSNTRSSTSTSTSTSNSASTTNSTKPPTPTLCETHSGLNLRLLESILEWLRYSIAGGIWMTLEMRNQNETFPTSLPQDSLLMLRTAPHLWLAIGDYAKEHASHKDANFVLAPEPQRGLGPQADGCVACVLARIGGCEELLVQLRAGHILHGDFTKDASERQKHFRKWIDGWVRQCAKDAVACQIRSGKRDGRTGEARLREKREEIEIECETLVKSLSATLQGRNQR